MTDMKKSLCLVLLMLGVRLQAQDQQILVFGATTNLPGATLLFENASNYVAASGYCFATVSGAVEDPALDPTYSGYYPYAGYYYNRVQVFSALPATAANGGPTNGAAAPGTLIQLRLVSVDGPAGASIAFWEGNSDGSYGTNLTWSAPVPLSGGTNLIRVTQAANTSTNDPYGLTQGRVLGFTKAGLYKVTWQLVDTSTNGAGSTPLDSPSATFALYYQADCTIAGIKAAADGIHLKFAAASGSLQPAWWYDLNQNPLQYNIEQSPVLGPGASWTPVLSTPISGDDLLHTNTVPQAGATQFYRLTVSTPSVAG